MNAERSQMELICPACSHVERCGPTQMWSCIMNGKSQRVVRDFLAVAAVGLLSVGCETNPVTTMPGFQQQVAAVRKGQTDEIIVLRETIGDEKLALLAGLNLRRLEIHHFSATAAGLEHLAQVNGLEHLVLRGGSVDDDGIKALAKCESLLVLNLPNGRFTDDGLAEVKALPQLELLRFHTPHVTDAGLRHLVKLDTLRFLHLIGVPITDEGLQHVETMTQLESFYIDDARVTRDGIERLLQALPELHVHINQQHSDRDPNRHSHRH